MFIFNSKEISSKRYIIIFLILATILFLYHVVTFKLYTSKVLDVSPPMYVGDLARMSYQIDSIDLKQAQNTLPKKHIEGAQYKNQNIDLLTIGYSFSNGGGSGKNRYYQDYIASNYNMNVLNISPLNSAGRNVVNTLLALDQSGVLDKIKPKAILLTTGARVLVERYVQKVQWKQNISSETIYNEMRTMKPHDLSKYQATNVSIINTSNYKLPYYNLLYKYKPCIKDVACKLKLNKPYFSVKDNNTLLFYYHDIKNLKYINKIDISIANDNINKLASILEKKSIKLYFMLITEKYDLYYSHLKNNPFIKNKTFDFMEPLTKQYTYINTKKILTPLIEEGIKDIYYADDTHWSYKASEAITQSTSFK